MKNHTQSLPLLLVIVPLVLCQTLEIQDLSNNNGYIIIKIEDTRIIKKFTKVLHVVNITEYEIAKSHIEENIKIIEEKSNLANPMFNTLTHNFRLLEQKISNLKPHQKQKRGLINALGSGLKYLTGTMDQNDEIEIKSQLAAISANNKNLIEENNKQVLFNSEISEQIGNITKHIRDQQNTIKSFLNEISRENRNNVVGLETEISYMQQIYQINYDINLLKDHLENIEEVILTSKLGLLSRNILTKRELELINDIESFKDIKIVVAFDGDQIIIVLLIPEHSELPYAKILVEPIPNKNNKTMHLDKNLFIVDQNNDIYSDIVKDNLKRNLIKVKDNCVSKIMNFKEAHCTLEKFSKAEIKEVIPGVIITKNAENTEISQNCNSYKTNVKGTNLIRFENCKVEINGCPFENSFLKIKDNLVLPHFITKVIENKTINAITFEEFHVREIKNNRKKLELITNKNKENNIVNLSISLIIIRIISTFIIKNVVLKYCYNKKKNVKTSSEPQSNGGGVIDNTNTLPKENPTVSII